MSGQVDELVIIWWGPSFGLVLGPFDRLFEFVAGNSVVPISARFPAEDPVPEEPNPSSSSAELLSVLQEVSRFDSRTPRRMTSAELFKANREAKAKEEESKARERESRDRRRDRSPTRSDSPSSSEPARKRRPSRLMFL